MPPSSQPSIDGQEREERVRLVQQLRETVKQLEHVFALLAPTDRELRTETIGIIEDANAALARAESRS